MRLLSVILAVVCSAGSVLADVGNAVCAKCHADIFRRYMQTGMARSSGAPGGEGFAEKFRSAEARGARVTPDFQLEIGGTARKLDWFLGSGNIGRSYLFRKGGQLFQAPLSYYSEPAKWDVSPGYEGKPFLEMTRAVEPACLQCHASRLQTGATGPPFLQGGVSCERCHGPGDAHAARPALANIVNAARLPAEQRDSVCAQCHLTGAARVARGGRASFVAGERLRDFVVVFVRTDAESGGPGATSHFEKLALSRCKQASGDKLWCGTCHTPHADATPEHYRKQCQSCHAAGACKANAGEDCVGCHMPKSSGRSVTHLAFTDHSIPRGGTVRKGAGSPGLREFWTGTANGRDTAMGYAVAAAGDPALRGEAFTRLEQAVAANGSDVALLAQWAQALEGKGEDARAAAVYRRILVLDTGHATAAVNLGTFEIRQGRAKEAMALWGRALARSPWLLGARMNLAVAQYQSGDAAGAKASLQAVLDYEPEHPAARRMLAMLP